MTHRARVARPNGQEFVAPVSCVTRYGLFLETFIGLDVSEHLRLHILGLLLDAVVLYVARAPEKGAVVALLDPARLGPELVARLDTPSSESLARDPWTGEVTVSELETSPDLAKGIDLREMLRLGSDADVSISPAIGAAAFVDDLISPALRRIRGDSQPPGDRDAVEPPLGENASSDSGTEAFPLLQEDGRVDFASLAQFRSSYDQSIRHGGLIVLATNQRLGARLAIDLMVEGALICKLSTRIAQVNGDRAFLLIDGFHAVQDILESLV